MIMSNTNQLHTITFLNRNTEYSVIAVLFSFRRNCYLKKENKKKSILSVLSNLKNGEAKPANPIGYSIEKVTCAMDVMEILIETETALHGMKNPEEICQYVMKQLCSFYQADYVGILEADLEIDSWFFKWWYRKGEDNVKQKDKRNLALPDEFAHAAPSWIKAYEQNKVISIQDVEQIKSIHPSEYTLYNRLQATSVIGCPFYKHSTGFVVVKNPARYFRQTALLRILTYVLMMELNEYKMMRSIKLQARNQSIESEKDVHINLCGGINVISMDGNLDPSDFTPEEIELLTYMAFAINTIVYSAPYMGGDIANVFIVGDSAGALLSVYATAIIHNPKLAEAFGLLMDLSKIHIRALGLISGLYYTASFDFYGLFYRALLYGKDSGHNVLKKYRNPETSEVISTLPPCILITCEKDILKKNSIAFYKALKRNGIQCELHPYSDPELVHDFPLFQCDWPEAGFAFDRINDFFWLCRE